MPGAKHFFWYGKCNYILLIEIRIVNKRRNLGKTYFENTYTIKISKIKTKVIWFKK